MLVHHFKQFIMYKAVYISDKPLFILLLFVFYYLFSGVYTCQYTPMTAGPLFYFEKTIKKIIVHKEIKLSLWKYFLLLQN